MIRSMTIHIRRTRRLDRNKRYDTYHDLTASIEEIFVNSRSEVDFQPLLPMKGKDPEKYKDKFCLFHNANNHTIAICFDLQDEIEFLIRRGKLAGYHKDVAWEAMDSPNREIVGEIYMIVVG